MRVTRVLHAVAAASRPQGALRKYRNKNGTGYTRNYAQLWARLLELRRQRPPAGGAAVRVAVLGKGEKEALGLPPELEGDVQFHAHLPYPVGEATRACACCCSVTSAACVCGREPAACAGGMPCWRGR